VNYNLRQWQILAVQTISHTCSLYLQCIWAKGGIPLTNRTGVVIRSYAITASKSCIMYVAYCFGFGLKSMSSFYNKLEFLLCSAWAKMFNSPSFQRLYKYDEDFCPLVLHRKVKVTYFLFFSVLQCLVMWWKCKKEKCLLNFVDCLIFLQSTFTAKSAFIVRS